MPTAISQNSTVLTILNPEAAVHRTDEGSKVRCTGYRQGMLWMRRSDCTIIFFTVPDPGAVDDMDSIINPDSLIVLKNCKLEPNLSDTKPGDHYQFFRLGLFLHRQGFCAWKTHIQQDCGTQGFME